MIGTPESKRAKDPPQTEAMDDDPLDSKTSEVNLIVKGQLVGKIAFKAFSAKAP